MPISAESVSRNESGLDSWKAQAGCKAKIVVFHLSTRRCSFLHKKLLLPSPKLFQLGTTFEIRSFSKTTFPCKTILCELKCENYVEQEEIFCNFAICNPHLHNLHLTIRYEICRLFQLIVISQLMHPAILTLNDVKCTKQMQLCFENIKHKKNIFNL